MKKALSLILVCLFLVSMMIPVSAAQFINAYETIQAENYSEASCASVLGLGSTHYLENCLDAGGGKNVFDWQRNTYFKYANVDFGSDAAYGFSARVADFSDHADLKIILDSINGPVIGTLHIVSTGKQQDWETQSCPITPTSGVHDVFLKFENNPAKASLNYFTFLHTVPEETVRPTYSYERFQPIGRDAIHDLIHGSLRICLVKQLQTIDWQEIRAATNMSVSSITCF